MQAVLDFALAWCFNMMIVGSAVWVVLRVVEKGFDIFLKHQQYEKNKEAVD